MELSYQAVDDLLRELSLKHLDIKDYCGTSVDELHNRLASTAGIQSPSLVFFNYTARLTGTEQRTFNARRISFTILYTGVPKDDYAAQRAAVNNAEIIGLEVIARINIYSKMQQSGWLYRNFDQSTVTYTELDSAELEGMFGMEFHFEIKTHQPLTVTKTKWSDGDIFC